ncbi:unnamed protein product [Mycena citricolor]|uniref:HAT C-terminal dimerisation domain-containing protein n=1 Tax=Mycena citricolor TaxID=2018698 RepID=A0AAD2HHM9_9AGAR|nr:unnamed protein product [Mycena citricolor]
MREISPSSTGNRQLLNALSSIRAAAKAGLEKLEVYYTKARGCQFNMIATLLHPSLGISWFKTYDPGSVDAAKILFEHAFESYNIRYNEEQAAKDSDMSMPSMSAKLSSHTSGLLDQICEYNDEDECMEEVDSDLESFWKVFRKYGRGSRDDPLAWWKACC